MRKLVKQQKEHDACVNEHYAVVLTITEMQTEKSQNWIANTCMALSIIIIIIGNHLKRSSS